MTITKEEAQVEIAKAELRFVLGKLRTLQGVNKMSPWAALEILSEFLKEDLHQIFLAVDTCQTAVLNVEMELKDLEKEVDEAEERAHAAEQEINDLTEMCTGCNRPAKYCGCDDDWRWDR